MVKLVKHGKAGMRSRYRFQVLSMRPRLEVHAWSDCRPCNGQTPGMVAAALAFEFVYWQLGVAPMTKTPRLRCSKAEIDQPFHWLSLGCTEQPGAC